MELSRQADYAVRAMVDLATVPAEVRVASRTIAQRQQIPEKFLPRIILALSRAQLVRTFRGKDGGVSLTRPASEISLLDVIVAIEGPLCLNRCTHEPSRCDRYTFCLVHPVWRVAQDYLNRLLGDTTLADIVGRARQPRGLIQPVEGDLQRRPLG